MTLASEAPQSPSRQHNHQGGPCAARATNAHHAVTYSHTEQQGSPAVTVYADLLEPDHPRRATGFDDRAVLGDTEYDSQGRIARTSRNLPRRRPVVEHLRVRRSRRRHTAPHAGIGSTARTEYMGLTTRSPTRLGS
ncbi:MAG: hypothetical protein R2873_19320 [Caldilineaceae bacterium]